MNPVKPQPLSGLDAQNPLGFLAALGLLRVLEEHARSAGAPTPKLAFVDEGQQTAVVWTHLAFDEICDVVLSDAQAQGTSVALGLAYDQDGDLLSPSDPGAARDLKPAPRAARQYLQSLAVAPRRDADLGAAFITDTVTDNNGRAKPSSLHFTAGQQSFLSMVEELRMGITAEDLVEAMVGPWTSVSRLPSLSWDSSSARNYALRASNPSKEKRGSVAGANWLAVHGLAFFPVAATRGRLATVGVRGRWKDSTWTWPVWAAPTDVRSIMALFRCDLGSLSSQQRAAAGVHLVLRSSILRSDQGGYGSFTPAAIVTPPRPKR